MRSPLALLFLTSTAALAQAPIDDALWIASRQGRTLTKVDRCGAVLQTVDLSANGFDLDLVARAPDGSLWVLNFITTTMTLLDRNGGNLRNVTTAGNPAGIAFDAQGNAWIAMNNLGTVEKFSPAGVSISSHRVGNAPIGVTVDTAGDVWVSNRVGPPGQVSKINAVTGAVTIFTLPATTRCLPIDIVADWPGPSTPSDIWVIGDRSTELVKLDINGNFLNAYVLGSAASGLGGLAVDGGNNIWVSNYVSGDVFKVRSTDGSVLLTVPNPPASIAVSIDATGSPWIVNRVSFSGPQPSELRKLDRTTGALQVVAPVGVGAYQASDAAGFQHARVTDRFGDADGDGDVNFGETLGGTSPYDDQSNSKTHVEFTGPSRIGGNVQLQASGTAGGVMVMFFGRARGPGLSVPGIAGQMRLDPIGLFGFTAPIVVPGSLTLPIPNDTSLDGAVLHAQGLYVGSFVAFSNTTCVKIWI